MFTKKIIMDVSRIFGEGIIEVIEICIHGADTSSLDHDFRSAAQSPWRPPRALVYSAFVCLFLC